MNKKKVIFRATVDNFSGYGSVSRSLILAFYKKYKDSYDIALQNLQWLTAGDIELSPEDREILDLLRRKEYPPEESILIHMSIPIEFQWPHNYKKYFGFTMLETDKITPTWAYILNRLDGCIVPTPFNVKTFMESGVKVPITIIPFGVDFDMYTLDKQPLLPKEEITTKFNFLSIGQWTPGDRKNISQMILSFLKTFRTNKDVGLILKVYGKGAGTIDKIQCIEKINAIRNHAGLGLGEGPKVYLVHGALTPEDMSKLYHNADVFILPSSGEAFGMPIIEAIASGLPIITTGGTAPDTYLNPEKTVILNYKWVLLRQELFWQYVYEPGMNMTEPDWKEFERVMVRAFEKNEMAKEKALEQRQELIDRKLTWETSAEKLALFLDNI
jgi:hypothetical protein